MEIELCGYKVQIDEEDYDRVMALHWGIDKAAIKRRHGLVYFFHSFRDSGEKRYYRVALHRYILGLAHNNGLVVDHINGDTFDNRKCNLRICTSAENSKNARTPITNTSGYKGVSYRRHTNRYISRIRVNNEGIYLGSFDTPEEAYVAYCNASKKYHGEFGRTK